MILDGPTRPGRALRFEQLRIRRVRKKMRHLARLHRKNVREGLTPDEVRIARRLRLGLEGVPEFQAYRLERGV